jgi:hypothetical protein
LWLSAAAARSEAQTVPPRVVQQALDAVYAYTDDRGQLIYVNRLDDVPVRLRAYARRVDQPDAPADGDSVAALLAWLKAPTPGASGALYRYKSRAGHLVFTNLVDEVPPDQRAAAQLDLSHVSLNSTLGAELERRLKTRFEALRESAVCRGARADELAPIWQRAWTEHRAASTFAAVLLVFLLITPTMTRRVGGAAWARALSLAIPVLGLAAIISFVLVQAGRSSTQLIPKGCDAAAWASAGHADQPLVQQLKLVSALEAETKAIEQIHAESQ